MSELVFGFALMAAVLTISALASNFVERAPLSFPMIFLGLGLVLGQLGFGLFKMDVHNTALEAIAVVSLSLVLFLDAVKMQLDELRRNWLVSVLTLGPGTFLIIAGIAIAAYLLVGTTPIQSLLLGAVLASTDPVVLRDVLRNERIPRSVRQALGVEAGMNDIVVLPIVLVVIAVLKANLGGALDWTLFLGKLLILSPLVGLIVGGVGAWLMGKADARWGIRREYQALYGIGLVLASYVAGQAVQGDGFLAAFAAGLGITLFNVSLCDCFLDYGEITSEMAMLFTFVLFGVVLSSLLPTLPIFATLTLALLAIVVIRPLAMWLVLQRARMSNNARAFIGWFGPRGLSSLLLALLVVQGGVANSEHLLAITGMVVLVSVIAHGASATPLATLYANQVADARPTFEEEREATATGLFQRDGNSAPHITPTDLATLLAGPNPTALLDVRSRARYTDDPDQIPGSIRVLPDQIDDWLKNEQQTRPIVAYCTCPDDGTSRRVAQQFRDRGVDAAFLQGGFDAWKEAGLPVEPKRSAVKPEIVFVEKASQSAVGSRQPAEEREKAESRKQHAEGNS